VASRPLDVIAMIAAMALLMTVTMMLAR